MSHGRSDHWIIHLNHSGSSFEILYLVNSDINTLCSGLFEIWIFSVQKIYSGFKVIEAGIFFTETSDYFSEIIWSSYRPCSQIWHPCVICSMVCSLTDIWLVLLFGVNRGGRQECSFFPEHLISLHSLYTLYIAEFVSFRNIFTD